MFRPSRIGNRAEFAAVQERLRTLVLRLEPTLKNHGQQLLAVRERPSRTSDCAAVTVNGFSHTT